MTRTALHADIWISPENKGRLRAVLYHDDKAGNRLAADATIDDRAPLEALVGAEAKGLDDGALICAALAAHGDAALGAIRGEFALAFWSENELLLARDPMGRRPLFYRRGVDGIVHIDSDALTLARMDGPPRIDEQWLASFLLVRPERGIASTYTGIDRVQQGEYVRFKRGRAPQAHRHWSPDYDTIDIGYDAAIDQATGLLDRAIAPLHGGVLMLSAGYDSNIILSRLVAQGHCPTAITASPSIHSDALPGYTSDESPLAQAAMRALGCNDHHRLVAAPTGLRYMIEGGFAAYERPMLNPSNLGWWNGCAALAKGLGHDQIIDGLTGNFGLTHTGRPLLERLAATKQWGRYVWHALRLRGKGSRGALRFAPAGIYRSLFAKKRAARQVKRVFLDPDSDAVRAIVHEEVQRGELLDTALDSYADPRRRFHDFLMHRDYGADHRGVYKIHGVRPRDPMADPRLLHFLFRLPDDHFIRDGKQRLLSKAMLDERIPEPIRSDRVAGYQGADWRAAAQTEQGLMKQIIDRIEDGHPGCGLFDAPALRKQLAAWPASGWDEPEQISLYRANLTRALEAAAFAQWVAEQ